jgi:hypothetical protein
MMESAEETSIRLLAADAWDEGAKAGRDHERAMWQWQAGSISRSVNGLSERPVAPVNPYRKLP